MSNCQGCQRPLTIGSFVAVCLTCHGGVVSTFKGLRLSGESTEYVLCGTYRDGGDVLRVECVHGDGDDVDAARCEEASRGAGFDRDHYAVLQPYDRPVEVGDELDLAGNWDIAGDGALRGVFYVTPTEDRP